MSGHSRKKTKTLRNDKRTEKRLAKEAKRAAKRETKKKTEIVATQQQTGDSPDDLTKGEPVSTIETPGRRTVIEP